MSNKIDSLLAQGEDILNGRVKIVTPTYSKQPDGIKNHLKRVEHARQVCATNWAARHKFQIMSNTNEDFEFFGCTWNKETAQRLLTETWEVFKSSGGMADVRPKR